MNTHTPFSSVREHTDGHCTAEHLQCESE